MAEPFLGEIKMFAGTFAPRGYSFCNGNLLPISQHSALFSLLGTVYGGDGRTTLALPDLRGRVPIHHGSSSGPGLSSYNLGQKGGQESVILNTTQLPSHNHAVQVPVNSSPGGESSPAGNYPAAATNAYSEDATTGAFAATFNTQNNGGGQGHNNIQPYLVINFIIALTGTYPSRS